MTIRRTIAPLLYAQSAPGRWLCSPQAAMDDTAAFLCRLYWRKARPDMPQTVRVEPPPRRAW